MINAEKINVMPEGQIRAMGIKALKSALGVTGTLRFLEQFDNGGSGDYTKEKYASMESNLELLEILAESEADAQAGRVAPVKDTFDDIRSILKER